MKTVFTFFCTLLLISTSASAQLNYNFNAYSGTYTPVTGGNIAELVDDGSNYGENDEGIANGIPIGFDFFYDGVPYNTINANSNGFASFKTIPQITNTRDHDYYTADLTEGPYASTNIRPVLAPLWDDLDVYDYRGIKYNTTGTSPNRVFTLEWNDVYWDQSATEVGMSFQIKLFESSNVIEFHYLRLPGAIPPAVGASIGITGTAIGTGNFLSLNNASASPTASSTIDTYTINEKPATNQVYRFTPMNNPPTLAQVSNITLNEGAQATFTAVGSDPDGAAQTLTYSIADAPEEASIDAVTGVFTWTPGEAHGGADYTIKVRVSDNGTPVLYAERTVTITVIEVNQAPVLSAIGNQSVNELSALTFTATATDPDVPAQAISYSLADAPAGATINATTGVFSWTPTEAQGGNAYTFTVRASDNATSPLSSSQPVTITVNKVNAAPVLTAIENKTGNELSAITFTAAATDSDVPAQSITYSLADAPAGATIHPTTGVFSWTPTEAQGGNAYTFTVRATDNATSPLSADQSVTISVNEVNAAPQLVAITNKTVNEHTAITFTATATDSDIPAQLITYSLAGAPSGASINPTTGVFSWTPGETQGGSSYTFTVRATDDATSALSADQPVTIAVTETNEAPVLASIGNKSVNEGVAISFTATATDPDVPAQSISYSLVGAPAGATIHATTGLFTWTPGEAQGGNSYLFTVRATDNATSPLSSEQPVTITVGEGNAAPVLAPIANKTGNELSAITFTATATDPDIPAQSVTYSLVGAPSGATINPTTGVFNWTPTEAQGPNSYTFTVRATDNATSPLSSEQPVTIIVNEANAAPVLAAIANKSVNENAPVTFTASATDTDIPAQSVTYSLVGAPSGASINSTTGVFTWTPGEASGGNSYTFTVRATDNAASPLSSDRPVTITVAETNTAPALAAIGNKSVNEHTAITFTATATDPDIPAQSITYSLVSAPSGATIHATTGAFAWTPGEANGGNSYTFTVRATDNATSPLSAQQPVTITVTEANAAPVLAAIGNKTVNEHTAITFTASATDTDVPAQSITYSLTGAPSGASINPTTGVFSWIPDETQGGSSYTFTVRATDNTTSPLSAEQPVTITVTEANAAPLLAAIENQTVNELSAITFTASATDPDVPAQSITYSLTGAPLGASINPTTGVFSWIPGEAQGGNSYTFTVRASDNAASPLTAEQAVTITVTEVNAAPVLAAIGNKQVNELSAITFTASATDPDLPVQSISYSLVGAPSGATINATTGVFNWTPTEAQGPNSYTFTVRATDNATSPLLSEQPVTIIVNEANAAPVLAAIGNKSVNEGIVITFTATATDSDVPAQTIGYSLIGAPSGASIHSTTGVFTWTPTEAQGGSAYTIIIRATDNSTTPLSSDQSVTITVNEVNAAPVLSAIGNKQVNELSAITFTASANDPDIPVQAISYSLVGAPEGAVINPATGAFRWTPTEAQGGTSYTFAVRATDNATLPLSSQRSVTITVNKVNAAPLLLPIGDQMVTALSTLTFTAKATDADLPAQTILYSLTGVIPSGAFINALTGTFTWTPTAAQGPSTYTFTIVATDNGTPAVSSREIITVTVLAAPVTNTAPVIAAIGSRTVNEASTLSFTATATDSDIPAQLLTYSLISGPAGASINPATGAFTWTPTELQGPNTFTFKVRVSDNGSPSLFSEEQITVTVNEVNTAPELAAIGNKTVNENAALTFTVTATDIDLPVQGISYSLIGAPAGAGINPATGEFTWTPGESQGGSAYTFTVRATDNAASPLFTGRQVTITVIEVNQAPVLSAIGNQSVNELSALTFTATATDPDVPAQAISYSLADAPAGATINATTGVFSWTPTEAQGGNAYTFTVRASDNATSPLSSSQPVTITVNKVNAAPVLTAIENKTGNELSAITFTAAATDSDVPAQSITYSLADAPAGATIHPTTGVFSWTPTEAQGGNAYTFTVRATDNATSPLSADQSVTISVNEVNAAPQLVAITNKTVNEHTAITFTATATDSDIPAQLITYSLAGAPSGASINPTTGVFSWTPGETQGGSSYTFTVRATDDATSALSADQPVTIAVTETNEAPVLASIGNKSVNEGVAISFTATATDPDVPAQSISYSLVGAPAGATIHATTGLFTWTPGEAQGGNSYLFTVRATDNATSPLSSEQPVTITVGEGNAAPVLAPIANKTGNELSAITFTATATDPDIPAQSVTYSLVGAPSGATINPTTGVFNWTPTEAQGPNSYTFTVRATDNATSPLSSEQPVTIIVNEANAAPVLAAIANKSVNENAPVTFTASATDTDIPAQSVTYSLVGAPSGASINSTTGVFTWTPGEASGGNSYTFTVRATDNAASPLSSDRPVTITVAETNTAPALAAIGNKSVNEHTAITFTATATDPDIPAQSITYSLVGAPSGATIHATTGAFAWTPGEANGGNSYTFTVRATDNATSPLSAQQPVTITVTEANAAPVLAAIGNKTVNEHTAITFTASATDTDVPAQSITYSLTGAPSGASINPTTGVFSWIPGETQGGSSYTFTVRATDNTTSPLSAEQPVTITVTEANAAPLLAAIENQTVNELSAITFTASATDPDVPAQSITYSLTGAPLGASINPTTGVFSWIPGEAQGGNSYTFTVRASDNAASPLTAEQAVTITVTEVNAAPVLAAIGNKQVNELSAITFTASATDPDLPVQSISYSLVGAPSGATINATTGVFNWTPTEAQGPNSYTFTVRATDNATSPLLSEQPVTIIVNEANAAPVLAAIGNKSVNALSTLTFTVKATDPDLPAQVISYSLTGLVPGGASINAVTGVFSWTPTLLQKLSTYTFGIRATDNGTPALASEEIITVTVMDVTSSNVPPKLASIGNKTVNELSHLTFTATATDANGPVQKLRFSLHGVVPSGAKIDQKTGVFKWTPSELQGPKLYTFRIRVTDNGVPVMFAEEQITITVNEVIEIIKPVIVKLKQKCLRSKCVTLSGSTNGITAPFTYKWSNGATTSSIRVCPTADVNYRLTITGAYEVRQTDFIISVKNQECRRKPKKVKKHHNKVKDKKDVLLTMGSATGVAVSTTTVSIYPNPTTNKRVHISIKGDGKGLETGHLYITDMLGRNVYTQKVVNREFDVNLRNQSKGVYLIRIKLNNRETTTKVILE